MNNPIIYNGIEYKDRFVASTPFNPSLKMRLSFLFCARMIVEHEVFTKEIMPPEKTICHVHILSIWDKLRIWNWGRQRMGMIQVPQTEKP